MTLARRRFALDRPAPSVTTIHVRGIELNVTRKRIKNLYIRVMPQNGEVHVSAPVTMPDDRIVAFADQRHGWIIRQQERIQHARLLGLQRPGIGDGDAGDFTGFSWTQERRERAGESINAQLPDLLSTWSEVIGRRPSHITLRPMSSRWGSCTPKTGRIRLNLQLGLMDPRFLEYVFVHEMTHLWVNGHGKPFQQRMDRYLPQWKRVRRELNQQVIW